MEQIDIGGSLVRFGGVSHLVARNPQQRDHLPVDIFVNQESQRSLPSMKASNSSQVKKERGAPVALYRTHASMSSAVM